MEDTFLSFRIQIHIHCSLGRNANMESEPGFNAGQLPLPWLQLAGQATIRTWNGIRKNGSLLVVF